ncbi:peptidylprolyl isomerase [Sunxiuqinia sp. sy24]|uniref:peptidylprolyl isomerase n=1 Tax=Sunxiuqinia sp. sy24 TaxID=3461495 RepID=UPI0040465E61
MKQLLIAMVAGLLFLQVSCENSKDSKENGTLVKVETSYGNITIRLFDETPIHRDNFIKLANEGFYDGLLFHRIIENFMIQGGDPDSKNAAPGQRLGRGGPGYTLPAEINEIFFHKKGVLAAARRGGPDNPEKRSSGSQFYILQGTVFTPGALDTIEQKMNQQQQRAITQKHLAQAQQELNELRKAGDHDQFNIRVAEIREKANEEVSQLPELKIAPERREAYTTVGGYPSLDQEYTIFGEVVEGLDVLDKIAAVETDQSDRPVEDIQMKVKVLD